MSAEDYAILLYNIPIDLDTGGISDEKFDYDEDIKNFLEDNLFSGYKTQINHVNLCYNI